MARKPGNLTPDSGSGNAGLRIGRSGPNSGRSQRTVITDAKLQAIYKAMDKAKSPKLNTENTMIGSYQLGPSILKKNAATLSRIANSSPTGVSNFEMWGLGVASGAAAGFGVATVANDRYKEQRKRAKAIKKASVKTRKGQSAGR